MSKNIILCGVGGQGTVLASKLLANSAMAKGLPIMTAETIGMAQRGGSVTSHVRIGGGAYSPLIPEGQADMIISFEPAEAVRMLPFLKEGGTVITSSRPVIPVTAALTGKGYDAGEMLGFLKSRVPDAVVIDPDELCAKLGSSKCLNVILLGAAVQSGDTGLSKEDIKNAITRIVPEKFHELNYRALEAYSKE